MRLRARPLIASGTALIIGVAVIVCACDTRPAMAGADVTADTHACCQTSSAPTAPTSDHSDPCPHCGDLSVAPAKRIDHVTCPPLALFGVLHDRDVAATTEVELAISASPSSLEVLTSPLDPLSQSCVLRL